MKSFKFATEDLLAVLSIGALGFLLAVLAYLSAKLRSAKEELEKGRVALGENA